MQQANLYSYIRNTWDNFAFHIMPDTYMQRVASLKCHF